MNIPHPNLAPASPAHGEHSLFSTFKRLLRGRYAWTALLCLVGGAVGAAVGVMLVQPTFRSAAMLRISPSEKAILFDSPEDRRMTDFEGYMDTQLIYLRGEDIAALAVGSPVWAEASVGVEEPLNANQFRGRIEASRQKGKQIITLTFEHADPDLAQAGVRATVHAFQERFNRQSATETQSRRQYIEAQRSQWQARLDGIREQQRSVASAMDATDLSQLIGVKRGLLAALQHQLTQERTDASVGSAAGGADVGLNPQLPFDPEIAEYVRLVEMIDRELVQIGGLGPNHPRVRDLDEQRRRIQGLIDAKQQALLAMLSPVQVTDTDPDQTDEPEGLVASSPREASLQDQMHALETEIAAITRQRNAVEELTRQVGDAQREVDIATAELRQIDVESRRPSRLSVVNDGGPPSTAHMGRRRLQTMLMSAGAGAASGVALIMLWGLRDRRVRNFEDVVDDMPRQRVLGMVPDLPEQIDDALDERTLSAAMTVHEIRSQLQQHRDDGKGRVVLLTSAGPGAGKTTMSIALAMSFGHSGGRTLLMDLDFVGRGVSSRCVNGKAKNSEQAGEVAGVIGLLADEPLERCCRPGVAPGMWVMPTGPATIRDVARLSRDAVESLIQKAREAFDMVIIDTGPILGSIECSLAVSEADDVVMVVARGENRDDTLAALKKTAELGGRVAGIVYNLASTYDYKTSRASISSRMSQRDGGESWLPRPAGTSARSSRYGPLAQATAVFLADEQAPETRNGQQNGQQNGHKPG